MTQLKVYKFLTPEMKLTLNLYVSDLCVEQEISPNDYTYGFDDDKYLDDLEEIKSEFAIENLLNSNVRKNLFDEFQNTNEIWYFFDEDTLDFIEDRQKDFNVLVDEVYSYLKGPYDGID